MAGAKTTVVISAARANSLSFLLVIPIRLFPSPPWAGCGPLSLHRSLLHLLRRPPLRILHLRPVGLGRRIGLVALCRLLPVWRRLTRPAGGRGRRSSTGLLPYAGLSRILLPAVGVGRRSIRPGDGS